MLSQKILNDLIQYSENLDGPWLVEEWEKEILLADIKHKLSLGWTEQEIFNLIKNTEHINPNQDEDIALDKMDKIHRQVKARLAGT